MSTRILRINELLRRELSAILHKRYQQEAVAISILDVRVTSDLKEGKVFVAVTGDEKTVRDRIHWLRRNARQIRHELAKKITFKQVPLLTYEIDTVVERGNRILSILDELAKDGHPGDNSQTTRQ